MPSALAAPRVGAVLSRLYAAATHDSRHSWPPARARAAASPAERSQAFQDVSFPVSAEAGNLLYALVRASRPQTVVEFGTSFGVSTIYLEGASSSTMGAAYNEATDELLALHGITDPASADFTITSQGSILQTATSVDNTLTILLAGIAAISLLVGGIGVMNIMLVSVTERVREIGLRKALGATPRVIRRQFLVEASTLGLVGGLAGAALGVVGAEVLPHFISNKIAISGPATIGAIAVAMVIGVVFGVYPASRAARLAPIEALRSD